MIELLEQVRNDGEARWSSAHAASRPIAAGRGDRTAAAICAAPPAAGAPSQGRKLTGGIRWVAARRAERLGRRMPRRRPSGRHQEPSDMSRASAGAAGAPRVGAARRLRPEGGRDVERGRGGCSQIRGRAAPATAGAAGVAASARRARRRFDAAPSRVVVAMPPRSMRSPYPPRRARSCSFDYDRPRIRRRAARSRYAWLRARGMRAADGCRAREPHSPLVRQRRRAMELDGDRAIVWPAASIPPPGGRGTGRARGLEQLIRLWRASRNGGARRPRADRAPSVLATGAAATRRCRIDARGGAVSNLPAGIRRDVLRAGASGPRRPGPSEEVRVGGVSRPSAQRSSTWSPMPPSRRISAGHRRSRIIGAGVSRRRSRRKRRRP